MEWYATTEQASIQINKINKLMSSNVPVNNSAAELREWWMEREILFWKRQAKFTLGVLMRSARCAFVQTDVVEVVSDGEQQSGCCLCKMVAEEPKAERRDKPCLVRCCWRPPVLAWCAAVLFLPVR